MDNPEVTAIARADALAARVRALVPSAVLVEVRRDTRWWVQVTWTGPRDRAAAAEVVEALKDAGLVLLSRAPDSAEDVTDQLSYGELLEVAEH